MARAPQTISPNAAQKRPQAYRQAPRRRALARAPQTISPQRRPKAATGAPTSTTASPPGSCSANDKPQHRPKSPQRFIRLPPHASDEPFFYPSATEVLTPSRPKPSRTALKQPKHHRRAPKSLPFSLLETPQNHPFARPEKAASGNSYSKPAISYNASPKVLPLTGACLLLHCHQDSNEIQIKK